MKTEQSTSQTPCSYITHSIFLSFSVFLPPSFPTSSLYLHIHLCPSPSHLSSCLLFWVFVGFGRRKELGQALNRTSLFALIPPTLTLLKLLVFVFCFPVLPNICWLGKRKPSMPIVASLYSLLIQPVILLMYAKAGSENPLIRLVN